MSRVASWQGSLRSDGAAGGKGGKVRGKAQRSALGDISNRAAQRAAAAAGGKKGASKPFAIEEDRTAEEAAGEMDKGIVMMEEMNDTPVPVREQPAPIDRADVNDLHNPKYAAEYVNDIYRHYRRVEEKYLPAPTYMDTQSDINWKMRALLVDWLVQVHVKFELLPQTLYLTVNVLDRFLEKRVVPRRKLQLVGCAAMLIASKYEEIYAPECNDFVSMSDRAFTVDELLKMESVLLNALDFHLTTPSPYTFLRRFMKVACSTAKTQHFATFLVERSLQEYEMLTFNPSMVAASALFIAQRLTDDRRTWGNTLTRHSGYAPDDLDECVQAMKRLYSTNQKNYLQAVSKKYSSSKYMHVSMIELDC